MITVTVTRKDGDELIDTVSSMSDAISIVEQIGNAMGDTAHGDTMIVSITLAGKEE